MITGILYLAMLMLTPTTPLTIIIGCGSAMIRTQAYDYIVHNLLHPFRVFNCPFLSLVAVRVRCEVSMRATPTVESCTYLIEKVPRFFRHVALINILCITLDRFVVLLDNFWFRLLLLVLISSLGDL